MPNVKTTYTSRRFREMAESLHQEGAVATSDARGCIFSSLAMAYKSKAKSCFELEEICRIAADSIDAERKLAYDAGKRDAVLTLESSIREKFRDVFTN
jgi:hypothetical protein